MPVSPYQNEETYARVRALVESGDMTREDVAAEIGCSLVTLRKLCRKIGIPPAQHFSTYSNRRSEVRARIIYLARVMTQRDVARMVGCSNSTVSQVLRAENPHRYGGRGPNGNDAPVPTWVPPDLGLEYVAKAREGGEEFAASWARAVKRGLQSTTRGDRRAIGTEARP